jgi:hypothetical protein
LCNIISPFLKYGSTSIFFESMLAYTVATNGSTNVATKGMDCISNDFPVAVAIPADGTILPPLIVP